WFAAWSPDGTWIYLSSSAGGAFHTWRQRFSGGAELASPEQLTSGPTEEEGIAMAPDGRSFITAVGLRQRSGLGPDSEGERQLSLEGYAHQPMITSDGRKLLYTVSKGASLPQSALWVADLDSGVSEALLPGLPIASGGASSGRSPFDVSPDSHQVVVESLD